MSIPNHAAQIAHFHMSHFCQFPRAILDSKGDYGKLSEKTVAAMQHIGRQFPNCGYGRKFIERHLVFLTITAKILNEAVDILLAYYTNAYLAMLSYLYIHSFCNHFPGSTANTA